MIFFRFIRSLFKKVHYDYEGGASLLPIDSSKSFLKKDDSQDRKNRSERLSRSVELVGFSYEQRKWVEEILITLGIPTHNLKRIEWKSRAFDGSDGNGTDKGHYSSKTQTITLFGKNIGKSFLENRKDRVGEGKDMETNYKSYFVRILTHELSHVASAVEAGQYYSEKELGGTFADTHLHKNYTPEIFTPEQSQYFTEKISRILSQISDSQIYIEEYDFAVLNKLRENFSSEYAAFYAFVEIEALLIHTYLQNPEHLQRIDLEQKKYFADLPKEKQPDEKYVSLEETARELVAVITGKDAEQIKQTQEALQRYIHQAPFPFRIP